MSSETENPYEASEISSNSVPFEHAPEEHPRFGLVHKMVLQGEPKERVYKRLETNSVTGTEADLLYQHARKERVANVRHEFMKKSAAGLGMILFSIIVFCVFLFGLGFIANYILYLLCGISVFGLWKLGSGIGGYLNAESWKGSVADEM